MFENIIGFFKKMNKKEEDKTTNKDTAKERLHLVLMQDRANVSADFLDMMRQEIIDVIKKYVDVDESEIDVKLTNKQNGDGTVGAPALYANIPIRGIKNESRKLNKNDENVKTSLEEEKQNNKENIKENTENIENIENVKNVENKIEQNDKISEQVNYPIESIEEKKVKEENIEVEGKKEVKEEKKSSTNNVVNSQKKNVNKKIKSQKGKKTKKQK